MPSAESQQGLREKLNKEGVDSILAVFSSIYLADVSDRSAETTVGWIKECMSNPNYAISDDLAKKLERVLREITSSRENKERTQQQDPFGKVDGTKPERAEGDSGRFGDHPAGKD